MFGPRTVLRKARSLLASVTTWLVFLFCERLLPTDDRCWCFCTWDRHDHTLDNPRAVFEAVKDDPSIIKVVLQKVHGPTRPIGDGQSVKFVPAETLRGAYYLARSRVILLGYAARVLSSYSPWLTSKHLIVQLWHGVPLRKVGRLFPRETWWEAETPKYSAMVASSEQDRLHLTRAFAPIPPDRVWVTGLPRNDFLLSEDTALPADYRVHLDELRRVLAGRRLVLYAPTWRASEQGLRVFSKAEKASLEPLLRRHQAVLGIRGHSNVRHFKGYTEGHASPVMLSLNDIPDVNIILRETAVLVSDYSSIYIDFLLTDRPIIHFTYDFEEYGKDREGFLYDLDLAFAGPSPRRFDELLRCLDEALSVGVSDGARYARAKAMFHAHGEGAGAAVADRIRRLIAQPEGVSSNSR